VHELSIASAIVAIAERHAGGRRVTRVEVRVGHLRQVVPPALEFAWRLVTEGTALDGAELALKVVPAAGRCRACTAESVLESFPLTCGRCGAFDLELLAGEELQVDALELEEDTLTTTEGTHHGD
jgi:hydrogenase nickel incorporation protein HypA/HybF